MNYYVYPSEYKMSIRKVFHFWPSEIAASVCEKFSLDGPYWDLHMGIVVQKSALPTLFNFARVRAASQPHVRRLGLAAMVG